MVECGSMPDEPTPTPRVVGRNVRRLLSEKKITQVQLARGVEVDPSTIGQYIRGDIDMPVSRLSRIADVLDAKPCHFFLDDQDAA
jgi:transcriptional regulator with XRE-family HTH domain